jgi:hypothetical protein
MAIVLKFKQGDSGTELSLNAGEAGFQLAGQGWSPAVATPVHMGDPPPIGETIHLLLANTSHNNIATNMQSLHEMQVLADRYINDPHQEDPVWLHAKMDNETGERRALVYRIEAQYKTSWFGPQATALDIPLVLTVVRGPYWESTSVRNLPDAAPSAAACVVYDYTAAGDVVAAHDIVGDVGARLRFFDLYNVNNDLERFWMGIRSAGKHGADGITNFINIWECENGTNNASESGVTDEVDATASGGNMVEVTETDLEWDDTWQQVLDIDINDVTANEEDQRGNFQWLLRAKVDSGSWEVRLSVTTGVDAYAPSSYVSKRMDIVEITDTDWRYYEMGIAPMSERNIHAIIASDMPKGNESGFHVYIYARRTGAASGDLNVDCVIPMPVDEGFIKFEWFSSFLDKMFGQSPEGTWSAIGGAYGASMGIVLHEPESIENFVLPPGDGRIYCVYETPGSSDIADVIIFNQADRGRYYERWLSLRGSE